MRDIDFHPYRHVVLAVLNRTTYREGIDVMYTLACGFADEDGCCHPGIGTIAHLIGDDEGSRTSKVLSQLRRSGDLHFEPTDGSVNFYRLTPGGRHVREGLGETGAKPRGKVVDDLVENEDEDFGAKVVGNLVGNHDDKAKDLIRRGANAVAAERAALLKSERDAGSSSSSVSLVGTNLDGTEESNLLLESDFHKPPRQNWRLLSARILTAIVSFGRMRSPEARDSLGAEAWVVVQHIGWTRLCAMDEADVPYAVQAAVADLAAR
jgi:hypothetical protein